MSSCACDLATPTTPRLEERCSSSLLTLTAFIAGCQICSAHSKRPKNLSANLPAEESTSPLRETSQVLTAARRNSGFYYLNTAGSARRSEEFPGGMTPHPFLSHQLPPPPSSPGQPGNALETKPPSDLRSSSQLRLIDGFTGSCEALKTKTKASTSLSWNGPDGSSIRPRPLPPTQQSRGSGRSIIGRHVRHIQLGTAANLGTTLPVPSFFCHVPPCQTG